MSGNCKGKGYGRIKMSAGDMTDRINHHGDGKSENYWNNCGMNASRKPVYDHQASASGKDQKENADSLRDCLVERQLKII